MKNKTSENAPAIGPKIRRLRQMKGLSQKEFAAELNVSQQAISKIEQSDVVNDDTLKSVAEILGVSVEAIINFDENAAFNNFINKNEVINQNCEVTHDNTSVEKISELYERLLKSEMDKNALLKEIIEKKLN